jgi:transcriptional regulator with XRE-family HTH domain
MKTGQAIKELRKKRKITQYSLAKKSGISQPYMCQIENDKRAAEVKTLKKIAKVLNVPVIVINLKAMEEKDIQKDKIIIYRKLKPIIDELMEGYL